MKCIMTLESLPDTGALADEYMAAHLEYLYRFHERGVLLLIGPLHEPVNGDALGVFSSREAAEEFVAGDPFVVHGVKTYQLRPWQEVLMPEPEPAG
jgi:uncharacterized protein